MFERLKKLGFWASILGLVSAALFAVDAGNSWATVLGQFIAGVGALLVKSPLPEPRPKLPAPE